MGCVTSVCEVLPGLRATSLDAVGSRSSRASLRQSELVKGARSRIHDQGISKHGMKERVRDAFWIRRKGAKWTGWVVWILCDGPEQFAEIKLDTSVGGTSKLSSTLRWIVVSLSMSIPNCNLGKYPAFNDPSAYCWRS